MLLRERFAQEIILLSISTKTSRSKSICELRQFLFRSIKEISEDNNC